MQVYLHQARSSVDRPQKELKGFCRVELAPGESRRVAVDLDQGAMSYFDPSRNGWVAEPGSFDVRVGSSSADIRLTGSFELGNE